MTGHLPPIAPFLIPQTIVPPPSTPVGLQTMGQSLVPVPSQPAATDPLKLAVGFFAFAGMTYLGLRLVDALLRKQKPDRRRLTASERRDLWEAYGRACSYCSVPVSLHGFHGDHSIPLALGGSNSIRNFRVACPDCNLKKGILTGSQFRKLFV